VYSSGGILYSGKYPPGLSFLIRTQLLLGQYQEQQLRTELIILTADNGLLSFVNIIRNRSTESSPELPIPKLTAIGWRSTHSHENRKQLQMLFYLKLFPGDTSTQAASWSSWKVNLCRREKRLRGVNRRLATSSPQYLFSSFPLRRES